MIPIVILGALVLLALMLSKGAAPADIQKTAQDMASGTATLAQVEAAAAAARRAGLRETADVMDKTAAAMRELAAAGGRVPPSVAQAVADVQARRATADQLIQAAADARAAGLPATAAMLADAAAHLGPVTQRVENVVLRLRAGKANKAEVADAANTAETGGLSQTSLALAQRLAKSAMKAETPTDRPVLRRGSKGAAVADAQSMLKTAGFDPGKIDGDFGRKTDAATRAFQSARSLKVDGIIGPQTWTALYATVAEAGVAPPAPEPPVTTPMAAPPPPTIRRGSKGAAVRTAQSMLKTAGFDPGKIDGDFGPKTETAVKGFQRARGLTDDGVVGPITWAALREAAPASAAAGAIGDADWVRFARAMMSDSPGAKNGGLGMFHYSPRRLAKMGIGDTEAWLASPRAQAETFLADMRRICKAVVTRHGHEIGRTHAGRRATLSGLLAVAHAAGPDGMRSWLTNESDKLAFPNTTRAYLRATEIF